MSALRHITLWLLFSMFVFVLSGCEAPFEQRVQQGLDLTEQNNFPAAISQFDQLIADEPNSAEAWNGRGLAKKASGDPDAALKDYDHAIQLDSSGAYLFNNRGTLLWEKGDLVGALRDFDRSLVLDPKYDLACYNRAQVRIMNGDHLGALKDLEVLENLVGERKYSDFFFHRGYAEGSLQHFEQAESDLSRYLAKEGSGSLAGRCYGQRGMNRLNLHRYDSALTDLKRAETLGERNKDILYYQGYALSALGRWQEAKEATLKTLELDPSFPEAKWGLGRCFEELGEKNEACKAYRDAIALGHSDTEGAIDRVCSHE